jgi:hypothetical protein
MLTAMDIAFNRHTVPDWERKLMVALIRENVFKGAEPLPLTPVTQRYYTNLSAAGGQHYTIPTVTIGASDDFELEFTGTFSPSGAYLLGNNTSSSVNDRVLYQTNRDFWFGNQVRFNMPIAAFASLVDGRLHTLNIKRTNLIYSVMLDGAVIGITSLDRSEFAASFSRIARRPDLSTGVPDFNGYLSDVKISTNGTLVRHYPLDDDGVTNVARELVSGADGQRVNLTAASTELFTRVGNYWLAGELSGALEVGDNLLVNSDFSNGTANWIASGLPNLSIESGWLRVTNTTTAFGRATQTVAVETGSEYWAKAEGRRLDGPTAWILYGNTDSTTSYSINNLPLTPLTEVVTRIHLATESLFRFSVQNHNSVNNMRVEMRNPELRKVPTGTTQVLEIA